jgi:hypothetical protein
MIKQNEQIKQRNFLLLYILTYALHYARSVSQVKSPKCAPQKRRGDVSVATAAVAEQDTLAVAQQGCCATRITLFSTENSERMDAPRTQSAALRAAYQNEIPARPQGRRVKRLRGRAAETIILHGDNPRRENRESAGRKRIALARAFFG